MQNLSPSFIDTLMQVALSEARKAAALGEVPVGAVIAIDGKLIAQSHNLTETSKFVGAHAELRVIQAASEVVGNWRLCDAVLCVTLEPCPMCCGAICHARIPTVVFGAGDSKQGAMGSLFDLSLDARLGPPTKVIRNHMAEESRELLKKFFQDRRG